LAEKAIDVYLNDHLAGATFGSDLASHLQSQNEGTALGKVLDPLASQIEEDRQTLVNLMQAMDTSENPLKGAATWLAEKSGQAKFAGLTSGNPELGTFMALESLLLGVQGKGCLWRSLKLVADQDPRLATFDLDTLIDRAETQRATLEREHAGAALRALSTP
jgi:hypothetical protein